MRNDNFKAILFATIISSISALILAGAVQMFRPQQELNLQLDVKKNILKALQIQADLNSASAIETVYSNQVRELVVTPQGEIVEGLKPSQIKEGDQTKLPVYQSLKDGIVLATCIPISGKGLWSTIYGYLALDNDFNTIKGITFYKQGETAGLGAEIATDWFQNSWNGKKILNDQGNLVSVTIKKGAVVKGEPNESHLVDGISGATMTGNGINSFIIRNLQSYEEFFKKGRSNG